MEEDVPEDLLQQLNSAHWCRVVNQQPNFPSLQIIISGQQLISAAVREAIHVRPNTKGVWMRGNIGGLAYYKSVPSAVDYHRNLSQTSLRALIYSGDHDMSIPHISKLNWIHLLNLTISEFCRAWFVDGQVAGCTKKLKHMDYTVTYATIKGAGHVAPEYKPKECYAIIDRFLAYYPI